MNIKDLDILYTIIKLYIYLCMKDIHILKQNTHVHT